MLYDGVVKINRGCSTLVTSLVVTRLEIVASFDKYYLLRMREIICIDIV